MKKSKGFTLIELVVVIVILGILAAVALPRFINVTQDAQHAAVKGTGGALASAVLLVRSQYEVNRNGGTNGCLNANCQINVQGFGNGTVDVNANGWPVGINATGIPAAAATMTPTACNEVFRNVLQGSAPTVDTVAGTADYVTTATDTVCTFTYQPNSANDTISYDASTGDVSSTIN